MGTKENDRSPDLGWRLQPRLEYHVIRSAHLNHNTQYGHVERAEKDAIHRQTHSCQRTELSQPADFAVCTNDKHSYFQCIIAQYHVAYSVEGFQNKLSGWFHLAPPFAIFHGSCEVRMAEYRSGKPQGFIETDRAYEKRK